MKPNVQIWEANRRVKPLSAVWVSKVHGQGKTKCKSSLDGVTAEMLLALSESHLENITQGVERMFIDLDFDDSWFRVVSSLTPKEPHSKNLNEFRPISCWTTFFASFSAICGCRSTWKSLQTAFVPHREDTEAPFVIERGTALAREWRLDVHRSA